MVSIFFWLILVGPWSRDDHKLPLQLFSLKGLSTTYFKVDQIHRHLIWEHTYVGLLVGILQSSLSSNWGDQPTQEITIYYKLINTLTLGVPIILNIFFNWSLSLFPANRGFRLLISANMQPTLQISIEDV